MARCWDPCWLRQWGCWARLGPRQLLLLLLLLPRERPEHVRELAEAEEGGRLQRAGGPTGPRASLRLQLPPRIVDVRIDGGLPVLQVLAAARRRGRRACVCCLAGSQTRPDCSLTCRTKELYRMVAPWKRGSVSQMTKQIWMQAGEAGVLRVR